MAEEKLPQKPPKIGTCRECALCDVNLGSQNGQCHAEQKKIPVSLNYWCRHFVKG